MKAVPMPEVAVLDDARTDIIVSPPRVRDEGRSEIGHIQPQVPDGGRLSNTALASSLLGRSAYLAGMVDDPPYRRFIRVDLSGSYPNEFACMGQGMAYPHAGQVPERPAVCLFPWQLDGFLDAHEEFKEEA